MRKTPSEIMILREGEVRITNRRVMVGTRIYRLSDMDSVWMHVHEPNLFAPVFFAVVLGICSVLIAISDMDEYAQCLQVGLFCGIAAILFFIFSRKTKYSVQVKNAAHEMSILETSDRNYAEKIVNAINETLVNFDNAATAAR
jgi:hypothetical protein